MLRVSRCTVKWKSMIPGSEELRLACEEAGNCEGAAPP
jgi:hypothetical protein